MGSGARVEQMQLIEFDAKINYENYFVCPNAQRSLVIDFIRDYFPAGIAHSIY